METYTFSYLQEGEYLINVKVDGYIVSFYTINEGDNCVIEKVNDNFIIVSFQDEESGSITSIPLPREEPEDNHNLLMLALDAHIQDEECY